jgi:hypothetical protein
VFENADEARRACTKDRETFGEKFGDRYVRVYPTLESDVADMQQAVLQQTMVAQTVGAPPQQSPGQGRQRGQSHVAQAAVRVAVNGRAFDQAAPAPRAPTQPATPPPPPRAPLQGGSHSHVHMDSVVKMKSLPFDATQLDIIQVCACDPQIPPPTPVPAAGSKGARPRPLGPGCSAPLVQRRTQRSASPAAGLTHSPLAPPARPPARSSSPSSS